MARAPREAAPIGGQRRVWGWGVVGSTHGKCTEHSLGRTEKSVLRNFKKMKQKQDFLQWEKKNRDLPSSFFL